MCVLVVFSCRVGVFEVCLVAAILNTGGAIGLCSCGPAFEPFFTSSMATFVIGILGDEGGVQSSGTFSSEKIADVRVGLDEGAFCSIDSTRRRFVGSSSCIAGTARARFAYVRLIMVATLKMHM